MQEWVEGESRCDAAQEQPWPPAQGSVKGLPGLPTWAKKAWPSYPDIRQSLAVGGLAKATTLDKEGLYS